MFLLIRDFKMKIFKVDILFTFHNVSINSGSEGYKDIIDTHLHSTMFLLIRRHSNLLTL